MRAIRLALAFLAFSVGAQEVKETKDYSSIAEFEVQDIHIPPLSRRKHAVELCRQLGLRMFIDLGFGWGEEEDDDSSTFEFSEFHFKHGRISEALDAYCKKYYFRWYVWHEANCIWLEPFDRKIRMAKKMLFSSVIDESLLDLSYGEFDLLPCDKINAAIVGKTCEIFRGLEDLEVYDGRTVAIKVETEHRPRTLLDLLKYYLISNEYTFAYYCHSVDASTTDNLRINYLYLGKYGTVISRMTDANLLVAFFQNARNTSTKENQRTQGLEIYRRLMSNSDAWLDRLSTSEDMRVCTSSELSILTANWGFKFQTELAYKLFPRVNNTAKLALLNFGGIPFPEEGGQKAVEFWKKAAQEKDEKVSARAKNVLMQWELDKKANGLLNKN